MATIRDDAAEAAYDSKFGRAIALGALIGIPVMLVILTLGIWLATPKDLFDSIATALLPGTLLGVFGGGFAGMVTAMD